MHERKYYLIQDGEKVDPAIKKLFSKGLEARDIKVNRKGEFFNFVGFLLSDENILISFPKNTFKTSYLKQLTNNKKKLSRYISILFNCIKRTANNKDSKYMGIRDEMDSNYPFLDFLEVYNYYKRYGLFTNEKEIKKFGYGGRISWKDTINKSPKLIYNNNLLFLPLVIKKNMQQYVFVSKCMAYVINSTLDKFSLFLDGERVSLDTGSVDFSNKYLVISQLKEVKRTVFKDIHQRLLNSLISFFMKEKTKGGDYQLKIYSFNLIWESMVKEYLRTKFLGIENLKIKWSDKVQNNLFVKKTFYPDIRGKVGYAIEPDYYLVSNNIRYIFDAKYYTSIKELDYKQISYYFLLKHIDAKRDSNGKILSVLKTYNALILPSAQNENSEIHFQLNSDYNMDEKDFIIMSYYLNTVNIMENYTMLNSEYIN